MSLVENTPIVEEQSINNQSSQNSIATNQRALAKQEFVVQRSKKPIESNRSQNNGGRMHEGGFAGLKFRSKEEFQQNVLNRDIQKTQFTNSYMIAVQDIDRIASQDPTTIANSSATVSTQFKSTHPSLFLPMHSGYRKYKMKDGRNKTGLNVIKEKPILTKQYAIVQKIQQDKKKQSTILESLDEENLEENRGQMQSPPQSKYSSAMQNHSINSSRKAKLNIYVDQSLNGSKLKGPAIFSLQRSSLSIPMTMRNSLAQINSKKPEANFQTSADGKGNERKISKM